MSARIWVRWFRGAFRLSYHGPASWLWFVGFSRLALLLIVALGALLAARIAFPDILAGIYVAALISSGWYLLILRRERASLPLLTWLQFLVDFSVVAATISATGRDDSFFTFLLVVVILEAGVLLGLGQGAFFATLAAGFMFFQTLLAAPALPEILAHWYGFLIQGIAFYFTAFISGYWNQRVGRMQQFQREILDNMNSGFLITDPKGLVVGVNKAGCQILDLDAASVAGRHVEGLIQPESGAECPITTALRLNKDFSSYEFTVQAGGQGSKVLGLTTNRILDAKGEVNAVIASFTDLTEIARMRNELQQQDRLALVGELSAGLAHEIRNPLASLRSAMEELGRSQENPRLASRLAAIGVREADHLNEIVTSFLDFARSPSRDFERVDLLSLGQEVREAMLRKYDNSAGLEVRLQHDGKSLCAWGDRVQLRQVLVNLAQNGIEAMGEEGVLTVRLVRTAGPAEVHVEDEGPGIPPDKVARIFEPFYTEKARGVGMGLAICMRIVTAHDGAIQAASRPGGGAAFTIRLPACPEEEETPIG